MSGQANGLEFVESLSRNRTYRSKSFVDWTKLTSERTCLHVSVFEDDGSLAAGSSVILGLEVDDWPVNREGCHQINQWSAKMREFFRASSMRRRKQLVNQVIRQWEKHKILRERCPAQARLGRAHLWRMKTSDYETGYEVTHGA